jgi:hypothetical protein
MMKRLRALLRGKPPIRVEPRELFAAEVAEYLRSLPRVTAVTRGPDVLALDVATSTRGSLRVNDALDKLHEQDGAAVFVATYLVFENASDAASRSVSIWTKGVRSYLPRTEKVMLVVPSDDAGATKPKLSLEVPFEAVEAWLARVPGLHPAGFETPAEFPGEEELRHALSNVPHVLK